MTDPHARSTATDSLRQWVRRTLLPVFARVNPGDITVRHHFTGDPVRLHSFRHKGYWWHGRRREAETMALFSQLVPRGATVIEVGVHIGYVAMYFARLVGETGRVFAFEPGANNLPYARANLRAFPNVTLIEKAVGRENGSLTFYLEDLTGQNNSFIRDFDGLRANQAYAFRVEPTPVEVPIVTLDTFTAEQGVTADFVKIDVEGFECEVLEGARTMLEAQKPALMVEVQRRRDDVFELLTGLGYQLYRPNRTMIVHPDDLVFGDHVLNAFCLHREKHFAQIRAIMR